MLGIFGGGKNKTKDLATVDKGYRLADKYEVVKKLGEGGFGAAFLVKSLTTNVAVTYVAKAQKLTDNKAQNEDLIRRFKQESEALQKLGNAHGQIPSLFDFFEFEGNFYLIQEYVKGKNLLDILIERIENNQSFSVKEVIEITLSLLEVLSQVHNQNIIHRDIKHQNIILREGDNKPVLIDFGIIKNAANYNPQVTGTVIGTPGYCPLEQAMGHVMFQSDLYAVAVVALVLLTGLNPDSIRPTKSFTYPDILDDLEGHLHPTLLEWFKESLAILPENRFASAEDMEEALLNIYNLEYFAKGLEIGVGANQDKIKEMEDEIASLKEQLKASGQNKQARKVNVHQGSVVTLIPSEDLKGIITTQKEVDGFNAVKRIIKNAGLDPTRLHLKDTEEFCGINIDNDEKKTLIRLYFNDEDNLSFSIILADGKEDKYNINTWKGIAPKKEQILDRARELMSDKKAPVKPINSLLETAMSQMGYAPKEEEKIKETTANGGGKDYTKYTLDNDTKKYPKNRLVLAVVKEYMRRNPKTTFTELKRIFPDSILGNKLGVVQKLSTVPDKEKKRYFTKEEEIILDANKEKIVVCNGWAVDNIAIFIDKARTLGFVIKAVSK